MFFFKTIFGVTFLCKDIISVNLPLTHTHFWKTEFPTCNIKDRDMTGLPVVFANLKVQCVRFRSI